MVRIGIGMGSGRNGWFPPLSLSLLPPEAVSLVVPAISYIYCSMDTDPWSSRAPTAGLDPLEVVVVDDATTQEYFAESLSSSLSLERMVLLECLFISTCTNMEVTSYGLNSRSASLSLYKSTSTNVFEVAVFV